MLQFNFLRVRKVYSSIFTTFFQAKTLHFCQFFEVHCCLFQKPWRSFYYLKKLYVFKEIRTFLWIEIGIISSFCLLQKKTNLKDAASSFYFSSLHCCRYIWLQEINKVKQTWFTLEKIRCNKSQKDFLECSFQMQIHKDALLSSKYTISSFQTTLSTWIIFLSLLYLLQFLLKCWIFIGNHLDL